MNPLVLYYYTEPKIYFIQYNNYSFGFILFVLFQASATTSDYMSITSSPEPMELETGHPPSLLSEGVAAEWPIEEDQDTIVLGQFSYSHSHFSEHKQVERDQTRNKILSLTSEDQLSIGENIRPHPAHSEEVLFSCITSNTPSLPPLTSPRRAFSSLPSQLHRDTPSHTETTDTVKINSLYKTTPFLNSNNEPVQQHHTDADCEQNSELLHVDLKMVYLDDENDRNVIAELQTLELQETPVDVSANTVCRRIPSPVITNGTQYEVTSDRSCLSKDSFKAHSLDTPPLSSTTPEDPISDPFSSISPDTLVNCSASQPTSQLREKEGESSPPDISLKQPQNESTTYELETPPNDTADQLIAPVPNEIAQLTQLTQTDACSSPSVFHDCQQDLLTQEVCPSQPQLEYSTSGDLTLVTEIETFSTIPPDSDKKEEDSSDDTPSSPAITIPPSLRHYINNPVQDVTTTLHLKKCEDIINMQQTLLERARQLKEAIARMEEKILMQQSNTLFSTIKDKWRLNSSSLAPLTHSHLLKLNHTR